MESLNWIAAEVKWCCELFLTFKFYNTDSFFAFSLAVWVLLVKNFGFNYIANKMNGFFLRMLSARQ